jgi:hypothetical protein
MIKQTNIILILNKIFKYKYLLKMGKSDNGNQLYLHYKYDSSNLSFSNNLLILLITASVA